ncbi:hypothetical protein LK540_08180 [Massilia sp. IC2-278]|uniref:hypothetical protein n=1 Tax=Massilia sp. IC2-278 TaxID=2887200 RepID=UPI001E48F94E|nr:hypothetical protein [Massilia sp. IC2-278]MCC2960408.1 hypothetical protein [Massilia sp. IC2-278]
MESEYLVEPVGPPLLLESHTDLCDLTVGLSGLRIAVLVGRDDMESDQFVEVVFPTFRGFRYLDEGDLLRYWRSGSFDTANYVVFELKSGGWGRQEERNGMLNVTGAIGSYREWLVVSGNACVNVIAHIEPLVRCIGITGSRRI